MNNFTDFEQKWDDPQLPDAGRSGSSPGAAGGARIALAPLSKSPSGRILLANAEYAYVPVVEAELRPDGTAEVLRYESICYDEVGDVLDSYRRHLGWFTLTDDEGRRLRGKNLATKLVIHLPDPVAPEREQAWSYRVSNPAPLCAYPRFLPPLNSAPEPLPLRLKEHEGRIRREFAKYYDGKPVRYIQEYISDFEDTEDLDVQEETLHLILDASIVLYDMTVALLPDSPADPLLADLFPSVGV